MKQLPQHLLARVLILLFRMEKVGKIKSASLYTGSFSFGVSLGDYILLGKNHIDNDVTIHHEWGHTQQSHKWGCE